VTLINAADALVVPYGIFLAYKALIINMFKSWMLKMG